MQIADSFPSYFRALWDFLRTPRALVPILTFVGLIAALLAPPIRERRRRLGRDRVTKAGVLLYLEVLEKKTKKIIASQYAKEKKEEELHGIELDLMKSKQMTKDDNDIIRREIEKNQADNMLPAKGVFEAENKRNHNALESLFLQSEWSRHKEGIALAEFIRYVKTRPYLISRTDFEDYANALSKVLRIFRPAKVDL